MPSPIVARPTAPTRAPTAAAAPPPVVVTAPADLPPVPLHRPVTNVAGATLGDVSPAHAVVLGAAGAMRPGVAPAALDPDATVAHRAASTLGTKSEGLADDPTLLAILQGGAPMVRGAKGLAVKKIQSALIELGIAVKGGADGDFGGGTEKALNAFRKSIGLSQNGQLDKAALVAIDAHLFAAEQLQTSRFKSSRTFTSIVLGEGTLARGSKDKTAVELLQATLYSLGFEVGSKGVDKDFGPATESAIKLFQAQSYLPQTGICDRDTLLKLDAEAKVQLDGLLANAVLRGTKHEKYRIVTDLVACRIYVIDRATDQPVARYLTSPGKEPYVTNGTSFVLQRTLPRSPWNPPSSPWAAGLKQHPPGLDNPMGLLKLDFGRYAQYFHGIPKYEEAKLGQPASHGCLRMSVTNIFEFHERYAEAGTQVLLIRDAATSQQLAAKGAALGIVDRGKDAGREYLAGYLSAELGKNEVWKNGKTTVV